MRRVVKRTSIIQLRQYAACMLAAGLPLCSLGQDPATPDIPRVEYLSPGIYRIGGVTLDKQAREVRFATVVNQVSGPIEYLLVGKGGKTHESVLRTEAEPMQVQAAMLLLGVQAVSVVKDAGALRSAPQAIDSGYLATAPLPEGKLVTIKLRWKIETGGTVERRAETVINNLHSHGPMSEGTWLYNGSYFSEGHFEAQDEKSFAALVTDPAALINNPRAGHDDDTIWSVATDQLPPVETPVEFIIQLPPATS